MKKTRQHYNQKKFLSQFTNTPDKPYKEQSIWVWDKSLKRSFDSSITNVGVEKGLLSEKVDKIITDIERECYNAILNIIEKECITCKKFDGIDGFRNLFFLYRYLGHQIYRTPAYRKQMKNLPYWKDKSEEEVRKYQSKMFQKANNIMMDLDITKNARFKPDVKGSMGTLYIHFIYNFSKIKPNQADDLAASLFDILSPILLINETNLPFITNDIGLGWYFPFNRHTIDLKADGYKIQSWLVFPITPKLAIFLCTIKSISLWANSLNDDNRGMMLRCRDENTIKLANKNMIDLADRFLFSPTKIEIIKKGKKAK